MKYPTTRLMCTNGLRKKFMLGSSDAKKAISALVTLSPMGIKIGNNITVTRERYINKIFLNPTNSTNNEQKIVNNPAPSNGKGKTYEIKNISKITERKQSCLLINVLHFLLRV